MAVTTTQVRDLLWPGLNNIMVNYDTLPAEWPDLFEVSDSEMSKEVDIEMKMLGLAGQRAEGAGTSFEDLSEMFQTTYTHVGVAIGFVMTKFAIRDNLYKSQFSPNAQALRHSMAQTKEVYAASVLNNATSSSYLGGDGKSLLATDHPLNSGTFSNTPIVPAEMNETALQDGLVAIRRFKDAAGLRVLIRAERLIIPPELQFVANRLMSTELRVGTSDNDGNAIRNLNFLPGGWKINDFLTSTKNWFIRTNVPKSLRHFRRDPLEHDMYVDFTTDNLMTKATERYSFGWSNARGIYGSMP